MNKRKKNGQRQKLLAKLVKESNAQTKNERVIPDYRRDDYRLFRNSGLWTMRGKYYGVPVSQLSEGYMKWVIETLPNTKHHELVKREMGLRKIRRDIKRT